MQGRGNLPSSSPNMRRARRIVQGVSIVQLLDELPPSIAQPPGRLWNVLARSLGEQGAEGHTALAWRWALTGMCPSPITLSPAPGWPPDAAKIAAETAVSAEFTSAG